MVFWVVTLCNFEVRNQRFGGRAASIFSFDVCDQGDGKNMSRSFGL
jgi:hypothetical protein